MTSRENAEAVLRVLTGRADAAFREGQWEAVSRLVDQRSRVLVVQRTGWGKSAVYFLATRLLRDAGAGPTLLISPLLALMRDQVKMAERAGVRAATINSANVEEWAEIEAAVESDAVDILLISPERLQNPRFQKDVLPKLVKRVGLLVVDEAHCISDWGHDFRPDYRRIVRILGMLPSSVPVLCTTATANDRVVADIAGQLGDELEIHRGTLERESLTLSVVDLPEQSQRLAWMAQVIPTFEGSGIVYCLTIADTRRVTGWLQSRGISAEAYSGETDPSVRVDLEERLLANDLKALVATSALGMGFDKPDLAFVIHYQSPSSAVAYYQQVGRAGRALSRAVGVLFRGREDREIQDYFINNAFPAQDQTETIVSLLAEAAGPMSLAEIETVVNIRRGRLDGLLKVLEAEDAVERVGSKWQRTGVPWSYDAERVALVSGIRRAEQAAMGEYFTTTTCRMAFLRSQLDDAAEPCGRCDNCTGERWSVSVPDALAAEAAAFLRHAELPIEPRKQWPTGLGEPKGKITPDIQVEEGRALSVLSDGGWGNLVRRCRAQGAPFPDSLVEAAAELVLGWAPEPAPKWIACVPSTSHPELLPDFAARLAERLGLEFRNVVSRVRSGAPQREMANSAQQCRNVYRAFKIGPAAPSGGASDGGAGGGGASGGGASGSGGGDGHAGAAGVLAAPVLLVDDVVDSRWTLTIVGAALRIEGSGPVYPFALAQSLGQ